MKLADILASALRVYGRHPRQLFLIAMIMVPLGIASAWLNFAVSESWFLAKMVVPLAIAILYALPMGALIFGVADAWDGKSPSFRRSYAVASSRLGPLVTVTVWVEIIFLLLTIIILGTPVAIYLLTRWVFCAQAIMLEDAGAKEALKRSGRLVTGSWWRVFGIVMVIVIVTAGPTAVATIALWSAPIIILAPVVSILGAAMSPFLVGALTLLFFDQRERQRTQPAES